MQGQSEPHHQQDEPCDICGNVGSKDALVTCSKCCIAHEHRYCMRVLTRVIPQSWVCEDCLSIQGDQFLDSRDIAHAAAPSKVCVDSQGLIHQKKLKPYETGKVKYLPVAEAIRLSSGTQGKESHERNNSSTAVPSEKVITKSFIPRVKETSSSKLPVTEVRPSSRAQRKESHENKNFRTATPSENVVASLHNPRVTGSFKLPAHGGVQVIRKNGQGTAETSTKSKDKCGTKEVKTLEPKMKEVQRKYAHYAGKAVSNGSSTPMCSIPISTGQSLQAVAGKDSSFEESDLPLNILPKHELYCRYLPAKRATWKGKFLFPDRAKLGELYGGFQFQAHPACKIHPKALKFSQNLPNDLQVKLLPQCPLWEDLFGDDSPDFDDIGLYFFPANATERSKRNYSLLIEFLGTENLLMTSYIDGVELLISTSKELHVDSQKILARLSTPYFLWGIFRRKKPDQNLHQVHKDFPLLVSSKECACDGPASMDNNHLVDMDIDMEGGRSVGRVDVVVAKEVSGRACGRPEKGNPGSATHQLESLKGMMALANAKEEVCLPPGYETAGFSGVSGACMPQRRISSKPFNLLRAKETHQEAASDRGHNPLVLTEKDPKSGLNVNVKVEGNMDDKIPVEKRETKELKIKPKF